MNNTIYALSSVYGKSGVGVFRISGNDSLKILQILTRKNNFINRQMYYVSLYNPITKDLIDKCMAVFFASPNSYTGNDTVEIFPHGSIAVINSIYEALSSFDYARLAEPGEFTKQGFLNNKFDLTKVEAIADLIDAETLSEQKLALSNINGISSQLYNKWRNKLLKILSWYEASIDFNAEEMPKDIIEKSNKELNNLLLNMKSHLQTAKIAKRIKGGLNITIIGKPNVGKSSLFNKIIGENKAIVSPIAGTTRDIIEASIDIDGYKINLVDTAGLNETSKDSIEKIGIKKAISYAKKSDIKILVIDDINEINKQKSTKDTIILLNKIDSKKQKYNFYKNIIPISVKTGKNYKTFIDILKQNIKEKMQISNTDIALTQVRYKTAIQNCINYLNIAKSELSLDLKTENIRLATNQIGLITGKIYFNEILDNIFSNFCLGK